MHCHAHQHIFPLQRRLQAVPGEDRELAEAALASDHRSARRIIAAHLDAIAKEIMTSRFLAD